MTIVILNVIAVLFIVFVAWWFWWPRRAPAGLSSGVVEIQVRDGVYVPSLVKVAAKQSVILRFTRHDQTPCAKIVVFEAFGLSAELPVGRSVDVQLSPQTPGEYRFACQMGMYQGTLVVV